VCSPLMPKIIVVLRLNFETNLVLAGLRLGLKNRQVGF
jgi:hypothetical protein